MFYGIKMNKINIKGTLSEGYYEYCTPLRVVQYSHIIPQPIILIYLFQPFELYFSVQIILVMIYKTFVAMDLKLVH